MQPNILFLTIDSLRSDKIYGNNKSPLTPNFDRLAKMGVTFTNAHVQAPLCGPSRASIMSLSSNNTLSI